MLLEYFPIVNQNLLYRIQILNSEPHKESSSSGPGFTVDWSKLGKFLIYLFVCIWILDSVSVCLIIAHQNGVQQSLDQVAQLTGFSCASSLFICLILFGQYKQFVCLLIIKMVSRDWTRARLGCTVDWVQLRTSTSPQLTVAILNLVQLEDYSATF